MKIDTELQRLELVAEPDDKEVELRAQVNEFHSNPKVKPDLEILYELACHLIDKNRPEEAIDLLLEVIAIDRNWNDRTAQKKLTDLFKKLGSSNEVVQKARKTLSSLLF